MDFLDRLNRILEDETISRMSSEQSCELSKAEAAAAIRAVLYRLNDVWPDGLEPNFVAMDAVDFAAMTGDRKDFYEMVRTWEMTEIERARVYRQGNLNGR